MTEPNKESVATPPTAPAPQTGAAETDDSPKFGRLLIVLVLAVMLMVVITVASEAFYS